MTRGWITSEPARFEHFTMEDYALAFLDILDQRTVIRRLSELPETDEQREVYRTAIQKSVGVRQVVYECIRNTAEQVLDCESTTQFKGELLEVMKRLCSCKVGIESFGDTTMLFSPINRDDHKLTADGIYVILSTCAGVMFASLVCGVPLRGGIALGAAMMLNDREIYGPAALQAYELEKDHAQYPRIVVDRELVGYLEHLARSTGQDLQDQYNRTLATICLSLLAIDEDGWPILNYLGPRFRQMFPHQDLDTWFRQARTFVCKTYEHMVAERDHKLAGRYAWLVRYFNRHTADWLGNGMDAAAKPT